MCNCKNTENSSTSTKSSYTSCAIFALPDKKRNKATNTHKKIKNIQKHSRKFKNIQEHSRAFKKIQQNRATSWLQSFTLPDKRRNKATSTKKTQEHSRTFKNIQEHSRTFKNIQENLRKFKKS